MCVRRPFKHHLKLFETFEPTSILLYETFYGTTQNNTSLGFTTFYGIFANK